MNQTKQKMYNYVGTGENPKITLVLSANGAGDAPYSIPYGESNYLPIDQDPNKKWSVWNLYDEDNNYYGAVTLDVDKNGIYYYKQYVNPNTGYAIDLPALVWDESQQAYQMSVGAIYQPQQNDSPFPDSPLATPAISKTTEELYFLTTVEGKLCDPNGNFIQLKGLVRPSLEWNPSGQYLSATDIDNIATWHGNALRLDLNQTFWLNSASVDTIGSYKQIIDAIIYHATENGMVTILDLHWTGTDGQTPMANKDSIRFWQEVADYYKNFGQVIFELYNEPYGISKDVWLNGGEGSDKQTYVGYQQLYDAVRSTGAKNPVIIAGLDYGYDLSFVNKEFCVNGDNIIYCTHPYNDKGADNYQGPGGSLDNNTKGILGYWPLIMTEFGNNQTQAYQAPTTYQAAYIQAINFCEQWGLSYTDYSWWVENGNPSFPCSIANWKGKPLNGGEYVYADMQKNPATILNITSQKANQKKHSINCKNKESIKINTYKKRVVPHSIFKEEKHTANTRLLPTHEEGGHVRNPKQ